jgi:hypothetical protein
MGIEPTTLSLGSTRVSNDVKSLATKLRLQRLNCIKGLPVECKTGAPHPSDRSLKS